MPILLGLIGLLMAGLFWILYTHRTVKGLQELDRDTKGAQRRAVSALRNIVGTPLERVRDPRLAAVILMLQLVRTGSPVTASEKTKILEFMEAPLAFEQISTAFEQAWGYTQQRFPFSQVADPLIPLLRQKLTVEERAELITMLTQVASAHSALSELQREGIARLKNRLMAGEKGFGRGVASV
ncbi:hypothetical protein GCM10007301_50890 [Azorhizobium oxalatiphilum]|uniref:Co-chaperone DjlA N-terminal domain-containing protein n=1 Tax=Azorhizobium oxalatiphilum TaxID=980631 RepID=A0A917CF96_9HYPH|nr:TerB family tellurite resistance protein [Azorhizobium oxalatiphilum]GGF84731.1 hypothetical protein GCM10007301_50890 [Azorhizobium oxalatiphilum]